MAQVKVLPQIIMPLRRRMSAQPAQTPRAGALLQKHDSRFLQPNQDAITGALHLEHYLAINLRDELEGSQISHQWAAGLVIMVIGMSTHQQKQPRSPNVFEEKVQVLLIFVATARNAVTRGSFTLGRQRICPFGPEQGISTDPFVRRSGNPLIYIKKDRHRPVRFVLLKIRIKMLPTGKIEVRSRVQCKRVGRQLAILACYRFIKGDGSVIFMKAPLLLVVSDHLE